MRLMGLAIQFAGTVWAACILIGMFTVWLLQPPPSPWTSSLASRRSCRS